MGATSGAWSLPALLAIVCFLTGCASESHYSGSHHRFRVGRPNYTVASYQVNGVWYYPKVDYDYDATGTASWYGPGFDGKPTSDGEIYDMNRLTAAHKTLPLPSVVQVTNLQNGRALRLRVNDRGPFVDGRIIDLSRRAAQLLGFEGVGTAPVRVRVLKEESIEVAQAAMRGEIGVTMLAQATAAPVAAAAAPRRSAAPTRLAEAGPPSLRAREVVAAPLPAPPPATAPPAAPQSPAPQRAETAPALASAQHHYWPSLIATAHAETLHLPPATHRSERIFIQAGAFAMPGNAQRVRARIASIGQVEVLSMTSHGTALYRVRLGPVASRAEAARLLKKVVDSGYPGARVVAE
jgi:rare lipoprotein A